MPDCVPDSEATPCQDDPMDLATIESDRRRVGIDRLLEQIRTEPTTSHWWNHPWPELKGRTPPQALEDGDRQAVLDWIESSYQSSRAAADRLQADPVARARIKANAARLRQARTPHHV